VYKARKLNEINKHTCIQETVDYFEKYSTLWDKPKNTVIKLNGYYEFNINFKYDYIVTYDFKTIQLKTNIEAESGKLSKFGTEWGICIEIKHFDFFFINLNS